MTRVQSEQSGFSAVEVMLVVVIVGVIGFVGWYVFAAQNKTNQILSSNGSQQVAQSSGTSGNTPGASDNATLQSELNSITSSSGQSNQDLTGATNAINDKSTFTAVPQ